jgi:hypothetical protein
MNRWISLTSFVAAAAGLAATASASPPFASPPPGHVAASSPLVAQASCSEAREHVLDWAAYWAVESRMNQHRWAHRGGGPFDGAPAPTATTGAEKAAGSASGPGHFTGTNVQEAGVDEADMVVTDGKYVYTVNGHDVVIVQSWPLRRLRVVARHALPAQVTPHNLLLDGDRLIVLSSVSEQIEPVAEKSAAGASARIARPFPGGNFFHGVRVTVLDVADRARPRLVHQADVEGSFTVARRIGGDVYLVSNAPMRVPSDVVTAAQAGVDQLDPGRILDEGSAEQLNAEKRRAFRKVRGQLEARFGRIGLTSAMPRQRHGGPGGRMGALRPLYSCADLHVPPGGGQIGALNVVHFDTDEPQRLDAVGLMASGWQVYASTDAIYAAMPNWGWTQLRGWGGPVQGEDFNSTNVHKFDLRGAGGRPRYAASGRVRGHVLNQFSMSEHRGFLRIATTDQAWGASGQVKTGNHLYVLGERGRRLAQVGAIEDLAPGERIYAARLTGDRGSMVTFRQTDPLYTLDLSDPRRPRVAGEIKINGFSSYIHPLGDRHLLTIGQDASDEGRVQGVHVQVFDISDPSRPVRTAHRRLTDGGWSTSAAQSDHHAFTYDPKTRVLAVPMTAHGGKPSDTFMGLVLLRVQRDSFEELGRVTHTALVKTARAAECGAQRARTWPCSTPVQQDWRAQIVRSIIVDGAIVSLSNLGLQVDDLRRPGRVLARVLLPRLAATVAG